MADGYTLGTWARETAYFVASCVVAFWLLGGVLGQPDAVMFAVFAALMGYGVSLKAGDGSD
jgi:hypothetical protein